MTAIFPGAISSILCYTLTTGRDTELYQLVFLQDAVLFRPLVSFSKLSQLYEEFWFLKEAFGGMLALQNIIQLLIEMKIAIFLKLEHFYEQL